MSLFKERWRNDAKITNMYIFKNSNKVQRYNIVILNTSLYHILESLPLLSGFVLDQGIGTCRLSVFGSNPACDIFFFFNFLKNLKNGILRSNLRKYCYSVFVICTIFCFNGIHNFIVRVMKITCKGSPATSHLESRQLFSQLNSVYSQIFWV